MGDRLNLFQRTMLRWRELHPYNPVHVARVPASLDEGRLRACIERDLERVGLTGLVVDLTRGRFRFNGGPAKVDLRVLPAGDDPVGVLAGEIEREFNTRFPAQPGAAPFRFVAVDGGSEFHLALAYDHFIAGGDSIALLLNAIAAGYSGGAPGEAGLQPVERYPATYRSLFVRRPLWVLKALSTLPRLVASSRRSFRPPPGASDDQYNAFKYFSLDPGAVSGLRGAGKAWGVTFNDLLMASALRALAPVAAGRTRQHRRRELAVASIVNIREDFGPAAGAALSPFLSAFRVSHPVPDGIGLRELVQAVHAQSARVKSRRGDLVSLLGLGVAALVWPFLSPRQRARFFGKHYPAWAGVTMLDVHSLWRKRYGAGDEPFDYFRAVPTGPLCPMVIAVTNAKGVLHVGVAYRAAALSAAAVEGVISDFVRCIDSLRQEACA